MSRPPGEPGGGSPPSPDEIYGFADADPASDPAPEPPVSAPGSRRPRPPREEPSTFRPAPSRPRPAQTDQAEPGVEYASEGQPDASAEKAGPRGSARPKPAASAADESDSHSRSSFFKDLGEVHVFGRIDAGAIARFSRQLGTYLDSGLPITRALASLRTQVTGTAMGPIVDRFIDAVKQGQPLSEAAARETQAFDPLFVSMLRVAEARGGIPETLKSLASLYEARQRTARQVRSALIYPTVVILLAFVVGALLTYFVLPPLVALLEDTMRGKAIELPWPTRLLIGITHFVRDIGWWLLPLLAIGLVLFLPWYYRKPAGKRLLDPWILRVPVMGKLIGTIETARMARALGDLLDAGVPPEPSLDLAADVLQFTPYRDAMHNVKDEIHQGTEFGPALAQTRRFAPDVLAFIETGEETGTLPESLLRVAAEYEERAEQMVKNLGSLLQPLFFLIIGGIVGFIAIAFVMAYAAILTTLAG